MTKRMWSVILGLLLATSLALPIWASGAPEGAAKQERVTLKMFMGNSGVPHPTGVDPSNIDLT